MNPTRASERNRRPKPTERERTLATYEQVVEPELASPKSNGAGRHLSDVIKNNPGNQ